jgi:hypothetical protein
MKVSACFLGPRWHGLPAELADRTNVGRQNRKVLRASNADPLTVDADFEGDHILGEQC